MECAGTLEEPRFRIVFLIVFSRTVSRREHDPVNFNFSRQTADASLGPSPSFWILSSLWDLWAEVPLRTPRLLRLPLQGLSFSAVSAVSALRPSEYYIWWIIYSTSIMSKQVIVIGGGLAGLSAAHTVLEKGGRVILVDKEAFLGGNSTKVCMLLIDFRSFLLMLVVP